MRGWLPYWLKATDPQVPKGLVRATINSIVT
jgi:hypothetical protein